MNFEKFKQTYIEQREEFQKFSKFTPGWLIVILGTPFAYLISREPFYSIIGDWVVLLDSYFFFWFLAPVLKFLEWLFKFLTSIVTGEYYLLKNFNQFGICVDQSSGEYFNFIPELTNGLPYGFNKATAIKVSLGLITSFFYLLRLLRLLCHLPHVLVTFNFLTRIDRRAWPILRQLNISKRNISDPTFHASIAADIFFSCGEILNSEIIGGVVMNSRRNLYIKGKTSTFDEGFFNVDEYYIREIGEITRKIATTAGIDPNLIFKAIEQECQ